MVQKTILGTEGVRQLFTSQDGEFVLESHIGHLLRKASQRASEIFQHVMGEYDVTPTQFSALIKLHDEGELSQNVLGRLTAMDPATILGVVSRLKRRGLVASKLDPDDGRRILLRLTDEGVAMATNMRLAAANLSSETLAPLSKAECQTFIRLLQKLA